MTRCPKCLSVNVEGLHYGKKLGGILGTVAGAIIGAKTGTGFGKTKPISYIIIGAIGGGITGCTAGATLGTMIDNEVLNNFKCFACGHRFSKQSDQQLHHYPPHFESEE